MCDLFAGIYIFSTSKQAKLYLYSTWWATTEAAATRTHVDSVKIKQQANTIKNRHRNNTRESE